eukprot:m.43767 g.43767  ORF g.43767 m.43767 type:complete len:146 (+) comp7128_c0_seq3:371-808(+)
MCTIFCLKRTFLYLCYVANSSSVNFEGSLHAQRMLTLLKKEQPHLLLPATDNLFHRIWEHNEDITEPASLQQVCIEIGIPSTEAESIVKRLKEDESIKKELIEATQQAVEAGMFGVPSFVVDNDIFFGSDRFNHIEHKLFKIDDK